MFSGCVGNSTPPPVAEPLLMGPAIAEDGDYWIFSYSTHEYDVIALRAEWPGEPTGFVLVQSLGNQTGMVGGYNANYFKENQWIGTIRSERQSKELPFEAYRKEQAKGDCGLAEFPIQFRPTSDPCIIIGQTSMVEETSHRINSLDIKASLVDATTNGTVTDFALIIHNGERNSYRESTYVVDDNLCWIEQKSLLFGGDLIQISSSCKDERRDDSHPALQEMQQISIEPSPIFFDENFRAGCFIDMLHAGAQNVQLNPLEFICAEAIKNVPFMHLGFKYTGNVERVDSNLPSATLQLRLNFKDGTFVEGTSGNMEFPVQSLENLAGMTLEVDGADVFAQYQVLLDIDYPEKIPFTWKFRESSKQLIDRDHLSQRT